MEPTDPLSHDEQKQAGTPVSGNVGDDHQAFLDHIFELIDSGNIDLAVPTTFLNMSHYENLDEIAQDKIDLSLNNLANQVRLVDDFRKAGGDKDTVHFHTMVEHVWEMKERIEEYGDVLKL